ncbi:hypothetical protein DFS33DRAFT_1434186 [Desarmillaria ectypa]|nr:hypothetical protein DFS33DRAFT_1434186 [Desarmillaria ectypa]
MILIREHIHLIHAHASLSSFGHGGILHSHLLGVRTVFIDHSLFGFEDAASILTNKLLTGTLRNIDASHTGRENVYVIPNVLVPEHFQPEPPISRDTGIDLLVATAPRVYSAFPSVRFVVGGDGPKLIKLLQMREKCNLQDRIELLGPIRPNGVRSVLMQGAIFLNTSLTESFGSAILEAACAGLYVVSTRVGGVPKILAEDMISFAEPEEDFSCRYLPCYIRGIEIISGGQHDPIRAHEQIKAFYGWAHVAECNGVVYDTVVKSRQMELWEKMKSFVR